MSTHRFRVVEWHHAQGMDGEVMVTSHFHLAEQAGAYWQERVDFFRNWCAESPNYIKDAYAATWRFWVIDTLSGRSKTFSLDDA